MSELIEQESANNVVVRQKYSEVTPMQMIQVAVERGDDINTIEKLMVLAEKFEAAVANKALIKAMKAFKDNPPALYKNKHVSFETQKGVTEYDHATLDHIAGKIGDALAVHGLVHDWEIEQREGGIIIVTCVITHVMGASKRVSLQSIPDASGGKNSIQAIGSTVSYLQRYTLLSATGMAVKGQDNDGHTSDDDSEKNGETMGEKIVNAFIDKARACTTQEELTGIWQSSLPTINAMRNKKAYDDFKSAVQERKKALGAIAQ